MCVKLRRAAFLKILMCGIFGYIGDKNALKRIYKGLSRLEYRGYDSSGIAVSSNDGFLAIKAVGKVKKLKDKIDSIKNLQAHVLNASVGIGHTRWATHGKPNLKNAHPHLKDDFAIVHNGVVENYQKLKSILDSNSIKIKSDTDTEIILGLIVRFARKGIGVQRALEEALRLIEGSYAILLLDKRTSTVWAAKRGLPLFLGVKENAVIRGSDVSVGAGVIFGGEEYFLSSDRVAFSPWSQLMPRGRFKVLSLQDNDILEISNNKYKITNCNRSIVRDLAVLYLKDKSICKNGYNSFMLKEIHEQPKALEDTIKDCINFESGKINKDKIYMPYPLDFRRVLIIGCGTSYHAGLIGKYWIEKFANLPVDVQFASELSSRDFHCSRFDLVVAISQSGETYDTLRSVSLAKQKSCKIFSITNVKDSSITELSDYVFYTKCGPEIGVASTKCFTSQLGVLFLLALYLAQEWNALDKKARIKIFKKFNAIPELMKAYLSSKDSKKIKSIAKKYHNSQSMMFLGKGYQYPIALEAALKLKEISYIWAEGHSSGEMKHGPIALIDKKVPVVVIAPNDSNYNKILSNTEEIRARGGKVILLTDLESSLEPNSIDSILPIATNKKDYLNPFLSILPLQLLSHNIASLKGLDVDRPRNLAKTVTVE